MSRLKRCWAPCFTLNSGFLKLQTASIIISLYTAVIHFILIFYFIFILSGGQSDTFFSPLFEFNKYGMNVISICSILYCMFYIICCSFGLIHGINTVSQLFHHMFQLLLTIHCLINDIQETRFYYLPWLYCTLIEILFCISFGIFMVYRYWHNVSITQQA